MEIEPAALVGAPLREPASGGAGLIRRGADLVHLAEELSLRLFILTIVLTIAGCCVTLSTGVLAPHGSSPALTVLFSAIALSLAGSSLRRPTRAYLWLRYSRARQLTPAVLAVPAVLLDGPYSPCWWIALPLIFVTASVSSTALTLTAALVISAAYMAGTIIFGAPLAPDGYSGSLAGGVGLPVYAMAGRVIAEVLGCLTLRLRHLEQSSASDASLPLRVTNLAPPARDVRQADTIRRPRRQNRSSRLTVRQLEVVLLVRDGLRHAEIATALGISPGQVERLLEHARLRAGVTNTSQLMVLLVTDGLVPPEEQP